MINPFLWVVGKIVIWYSRRLLHRNMDAFRLFVEELVER